MTSLKDRLWAWLSWASDTQHYHTYHEHQEPIFNFLDSIEKHIVLLADELGVDPHDLLRVVAEQLNNRRHGSYGWINSYAKRGRHDQGTRRPDS